MPLRFPIQTSFAHLLHQSHTSLVHALILGTLFTALSAPLLSISHAGAPADVWHMHGPVSAALVSASMGGPSAHTLAPKPLKMPH
jgi:hypothetical protein